MSSFLVSFAVQGRRPQGSQQTDAAALATLYHVNARVKRLLGSSGLNAEDNLTPQMISTYRRIAMEYGDPALAGRETNIATRGQDGKNKAAKKTS